MDASNEQTTTPASHENLAFQLLKESPAYIPYLLAVRK